MLRIRPRSGPRRRSASRRAGQRQPPGSHATRRCASIVSSVGFKTRTIAPSSSSAGLTVVSSSSRWCELEQGHAGFDQRRVAGRHGVEAELGIANDRRVGVAGEHQPRRGPPVALRARCRHARPGLDGASAEVAAAEPSHRAQQRDRDRPVGGDLGFGETGRTDEQAVGRDPSLVREGRRRRMHPLRVVRWARSIRHDVEDRRGPELGDGRAGGEAEPEAVVIGMVVERHREVDVLDARRDRRRRWSACRAWSRRRAVSIGVEGAWEQ